MDDSTTNNAAAALSNHGGRGSGWTQVHQFEQNGILVLIQALEFPNGRRKYSIRCGYRRDVTKHPDQPVSSYIEIRREADHWNWDGDRAIAVEVLVNLLWQANAWILEMQRKDAETFVSRPRSTSMYPPRPTGRHPGASPDTIRVGKTARDEKRRSKARSEGLGSSAHAEMHLPE